MSFSYYKKYYEEDEYEYLEAVRDMAFKSLEQSRLYNEYKKIYGFSFWGRFVQILIILNGLVSISGMFFLLIVPLTALTFASLGFRNGLMLKYKAYCLGLKPMPELNGTEKFSLYYEKFLDILFLVSLPVIIYSLF